MPNSNPRFESALQQARQSIDLIDDKIIALLTERSACVASIAAIKRQNHLAAYDANRENRIIERISKVNPTYYQGSDLEKIFRSILRAGLNQQLIPASKFKD